jgi:hypothetical protein
MVSAITLNVYASGQSGGFWDVAILGLWLTLSGRFCACPDKVFGVRLRPVRGMDASTENINEKDTNFFLQRFLCELARRCYGLPDRI